MWVSMNIKMYTNIAGTHAAPTSHNGNGLLVPAGLMSQPLESGLEGVMPSGTNNFSVYVWGTK